MYDSITVFVVVSQAQLHSAKNLNELITSIAPGCAVAFDGATYDDPFQSLNMRLQFRVSIDCLVARVFGFDEPEIEEEG
jgi:hypothetical protein